MEKQDLSQVRLIDIGYSSKWSFYNKFLSFGISTVAQVLDDDLMNEVISHTKKQKIRDELRGFIDLIKCEFLGKELTITPLLDESAIQLINYEKNECTINFSRMGFLSDSPNNEVQKLGYMYYKYLKEHPEDNSEIKIIDVFRNALRDKLPTNEFEKKVKIMISSYERAKNYNISLEVLKNDLENLKEERSKIDAKIMFLEEQIKLIKGGSLK